MKKRPVIICALAMFAALIVSAQAVAASCRDALRLCGEVIIPSLFPFFVMSLLLNKLGLPGFISSALAPTAGRLFDVSGAGASALIIGLTGGYPLGAAYIADMLSSGAVSKREGERLLAFCNNSGPAFIMGAVGAGVFASARVGVYLYITHILAAVLTGVIMRLFTPGVDIGAPGKAEARGDLPSFGEALPEAVRGAVSAVLNVCGFVVAFSVLVGVLDREGFFSLAVGHIAALTGWELRRTRALLTGLLELGGGVGAMRGLGISPTNLSLAAFLVGWGGVSVHFQTASVIAESGIKGALHFAGRLISACIGGVIAYLCYPLVF